MQATHTTLEAKVSEEETTPNLAGAVLTLGVLAMLAWGGVRVLPRYIGCALSGEFANGGTVCVYDAHSTSTQGFGSSVEEYEFLLRL